ncbi:MAG: DUF3102 domain-containing protein [Verrucomicrobia bacterium]|nr:DUF3102 domain-containing protein [Verrucomicrobiota bacterium]
MKTSQVECVLETSGTESPNPEMKNYTPPTISSGHNVNDENIVSLHGSPEECPDIKVLSSEENETDPDEKKEKELKTYRRIIRTFHRKVKDSESVIRFNGKSQIESALKCGQYLHMVKKLLPHGEFGKWVKKELKKMSRSTMIRYMNLWKHRDKIKGQRSLYECYQTLKMVKSDTHPDTFYQQLWVEKVRKKSDKPTGGEETPSKDINRFGSNIPWVDPNTKLTLNKSVIHRLVSLTDEIVMVLEDVPADEYNRDNELVHKILWRIVHWLGGYYQVTPRFGPTEYDKEVDDYRESLYEEQGISKPEEES